MKIVFAAVSNVNNLKRLLVYPVALCGMLLLFWACNQNSGEEPAPDQSGERLSQNLTKNKEAYDQAMNARLNSDGVKFDILDVKQEDKALLVTVKGGCSPESFEAIWSGVSIMIYPTPINLVLTHKGTNASCPTDQTHTVRIDLTKVVGEQVPMDGYRFTVSNGSKEQDKVVNPAGPGLPIVTQ